MKNKETVLSEMLDENLGPVDVVLDSRRPFVHVPERFMDNAELKLKLSNRYSGMNLTYGNGLFYANLSFSGEVFRCRIPWSAVYIIARESDKKCVPFFEDAPKELIVELKSTGFGVN